MNKSPFSFQPPQKLGSSKFSGNKDVLFNKKKISSDVLSMSSSSSASSSSRSSAGTSESDRYNANKYEDDENEVLSKYSEGSNDSGTTNDSDDTMDTDDSNESSHQVNVTSHKDKKPVMNELNEKRELLYQMDRLESKGYRLPFKFNMESDLSAMRQEYNKLIREKEVDASIRFQRKMLMAFVTGTEYMNSRYDPFAIRLEGWSEQVHETITDYDDIFEELHSKYKSTGKQMSPELRLLISLSGSAFMFHLTNKMFKEQPLPNVEQVLKSNPDLMKQFQAAAAKQYMTGGLPDKGNSGGGLFGMVSNLFNNMGGGSSRPQQMMQRDDDEMSNSSLRAYRRETRNRQTNDIDSIINNVHSKISLEPELNNIETLSISDEEITSIIEDTADIKILRNNKNKNSRTLNL